LAFGSFALMISTAAWKSKNRFPHLPRGPAAMNITELCADKTKSLAGTVVKGLENLT
jgi:ribosomal protein S18 acetylase RimI-like enzyme